MEKLCRLLFLCFFQFQLSMCDLLALKSELDALGKCYDKPPFFFFFFFQTSLFVLLFCTKYNIKCTLSTGLQETLIWFEARILLWSLCVFKEVLVIVFTTGSHTMRKSSSLSPHLVDKGP